MSWLKKAVKPLDWLIAIFGIYDFGFKMDYSNMELIDKVFAVCFAIWLVLLLVRCYIYWKGAQDEK